MQRNVRRAMRLAFLSSVQHSINGCYSKSWAEHAEYYFQQIALVDDIQLSLTIPHRSLDPLYFTSTRLLADNQHVVGVFER